MTLWVMLALMTAAAVLVVLWPLARGERKLRSGSDLAVYRDQLEEIQRDRAAGLIGESEAEAAQVEVSRRLIAAADAEAAAPRAVPAATAAWRRRAIAVAALVMVPLGASALYVARGSPSLPGEPLASRIAAENVSIENMIERIETHLGREPDDGRGWELISPIYVRLGRFDDAVKARRHALALNGEPAERQAGLGEALAGVSNGAVTAEAKAAFERAVALDAKNIGGRYYLGIAAEQAGRPAEAAEIFRAMLAGAPADAPWVEFVRSELARIQGGPSRDDLAAAGNELAPDQLVMIRRMVAGLAERLQKDGSDLDGWLRLMQSYMVLGEREKAVAAVGDARRALASEPEKLRRINERAKELGLQG